MRYRLRTLLVLVGVGPPLLAGVWYALSLPWPPLVILLVACGVLVAGWFAAWLAVIGAIDGAVRLLQSRYRWPAAVAIALAIGSLSAMVYALWADFQMPRT